MHYKIPFFSFRKKTGPTNVKKWRISYGILDKKNDDFVSNFTQNTTPKSSFQITENKADSIEAIFFKNYCECYHNMMAIF